MCGDTDIVPPVTDPAANPSKIFRGDELNSLLNLKHRFEGGIYTRQGSVKVPAGMAGILLIGREWKVEHTFHCHRGDLLLWDKFNGLRHITGPYSEIAPAGTQRVGWVIGEFEGSNIVHCKATTLAAAEDELLAPFVEPPGLSEQLTKLLGL